MRDSSPENRQTEQQKEIGLERLNTSWNLMLVNFYLALTKLAQDG